MIQKMFKLMSSFVASKIQNIFGFNHVEVKKLY